MTSAPRPAAQKTDKKSIGQEIFRRIHWRANQAEGLNECRCQKSRLLRHGRSVDRRQRQGRLVLDNLPPLITTCTEYWSQACSNLVQC